MQTSFMCIIRMEKNVDSASFVPTDRISLF